MSGPYHDNGATGSGSPNNLTSTQHLQPTSPPQSDQGNPTSSFLNASNTSFIDDSTQDSDDATNFAALFQQIQEEQSGETGSQANTDEDNNTSAEIDSVAAALSEQILRALNSSLADATDNASNDENDDFSADPHLSQSSSAHLQDPVRQDPSQNVPETLPPPSPPPRTDNTQDDNNLATDLAEVSDIDVQQLLASVSALTQNLEDDLTQEPTQPDISHNHDITSSLNFLQNQLATIDTTEASPQLSSSDQSITIENNSTNSFSDDALLSQISDALSRNAALAVPEKVEDTNTINNSTSPIDLSEFYGADSAMAATIDSAAGAAAEALVNAVTTNNGMHIDPDDSTDASTDNFNEIILNALKMALDSTNESTSDQLEPLSQAFSALSSLPSNDHSNDNKNNNNNNNDHLMIDDNNDLKNTTPANILDSTLNETIDENEDDVAQSLKFLSGILMQAEKADTEQEDVNMLDATTKTTTSVTPNFVSTTKTPIQAPPKNSFASPIPRTPFQPVGSPASVYSPAPKISVPVTKPALKPVSKPAPSSTRIGPTQPRETTQVPPPQTRVSTPSSTNPPARPLQKIVQPSAPSRSQPAPVRNQQTPSTITPHVQQSFQKAPQIHKSSHSQPLSVHNESTPIPIRQQQVPQKPASSYRPVPTRPSQQQLPQAPQSVTTPPIRQPTLNQPLSTSSQSSSSVRRPSVQRRPSTTSSSQQALRRPSISSAARRRSRANSFKAVAAALAKKRHFSFDGNRFAIDDDDDDDENVPVSESQQQAIMAQLASLLGQDSDFLMGDDEAIDESEEIDSLSQPNSPDLSAIEQEMAQSIFRQLEQHSHLFTEPETPNKPLPESEPITEEPEEEDEGDIDLEKVLAEAIGKSLTEQMHQQEDQPNIVEESQEGPLDYSSVLSALQQAIQEAAEEQPSEHMDLDSETSDIDEDVFKPAPKLKPVEHTQEEEEQFLASDIEAALQSLLSSTAAEEPQEQPVEKPNLPQQQQQQPQQLQHLLDEDEESLQTATMLVETLLNSGLVSLEQIAALGQPGEISEEMQPEPIQHTPQLQISMPQQQRKQVPPIERPPVSNVTLKQVPKPVTKTAPRVRESGAPPTASAATSQQRVRNDVEAEQQYRLHQQHQNDVLQMQNQQLQFQHQQLQQLQQKTSGYHPPLPPLPPAVIPSIPLPYTKTQPKQTQQPSVSVQQSRRAPPVSQQKPTARPIPAATNAPITVSQQRPTPAVAPPSTMPKPKPATVPMPTSIPLLSTSAPSAPAIQAPMGTTQAQSKLSNKVPSASAVSSPMAPVLKNIPSEIPSTSSLLQNHAIVQTQTPAQSSTQGGALPTVQASKVHAPVSVQRSVQPPIEVSNGPPTQPKSTTISVQQKQTPIRTTPPPQSVITISPSPPDIASSNQSPQQIISPTLSPSPPFQPQQQQPQPQEQGQGQQQQQSSQPAQKSSAVGSMSIAETLAFARAHMSLKPAENKIDPMVARREMNLAALRARQSTLGGSSVLSTAQALVSSAIAGVRAAAAVGSSPASAGSNRNLSTDKFQTSLRAAGINSQSSGGVKYKMYTPGPSTSSGSGSSIGTSNVNSRQGASASSNLGNTLANSLSNLSMRPRAAASQTKFYYYTPPGKTAGQSSERPAPAFSSIPRFSTEPTAMNNMRRPSATGSANNMSALLNANHRNLARDLVSGRMTPASTAAASAIAAAAVQATGSRRSSSTQDGGSTGATQGGVAANVITALLLAKQMMAQSNVTSGEVSNSIVDEDGDVQMENTTDENRSVDDQTMEAIQEALQALGRSLQDGEPGSTGSGSAQGEMPASIAGERFASVPVSMSQPVASAASAKQPPLDDKAFEVPDMTGMTDKERVRVLNRLRKKRWRYNNLDRNRDNDLRTRVVRQATKLYGSENTPEKLAWIEKEFNQRKTRRRDRSTASVPYTMVQKPTPAGLVVANRSVFHPGSTSTTTMTTESLPGGKLTVTPASSFAKPATSTDPSASAALASAKRSVDAFNNTISAQSRQVLTTIDLTKSSESNTSETAITIESDHEEETNSLGMVTPSPNKRKRSISSDQVTFSANTGPPASLSFKPQVGFTTVPHPKLSRISSSVSGISAYPPRTVFTANLLPCQILHNNFNDKSIPKPLPYTPPVSTPNNGRLPPGSGASKNSSLPSTTGNSSTNGTSLLGSSGVSMGRGIPGGPTAGISATSASASAAGSTSNKPGFLSRFPRFNLSAATRPSTLTGGMGPVMNLGGGPPATLSGGMPPSSLSGGGMTSGPASRSPSKGLTPPLSISNGGGVLSRQVIFNSNTTPTTSGGSITGGTTGATSAGGSTVGAVGSGTSSSTSGTSSPSGPSAPLAGHATPRASAPVVVTGPIRP